MLAITVQQPWAWAIIHGGKNVENRTRIGTWKRAEGQRIAIHAGQRWSTRGEYDDRVCAAASELWRNAATLRTTGAIIGTVRVDEVHHADFDCDPDQCTPWGEHSYREHGGDTRTNVVHLLLSGPRACEPIDCRGALGLWRVPTDVTRILEAGRR